jgi:hypothetical protein
MADGMSLPGQMVARKKKDVRTPRLAAEPPPAAGFRGKTLSARLRADGAATAAVAGVAQVPMS